MAEKKLTAADVMTLGAVTVRADASVSEAARLMLQYQLSGLPVVDEQERLVGIITERDFLRRPETGTDRRERPRWAEFLFQPGALAQDYVRSHSRKVEDVMTRGVITVNDDTPLTTVVDLMERHRIKRLPVLRNGKLVGIVSGANLLRAVARPPEEPPEAPADQEIRDRVLAALAEEPWTPKATIDVTVRDGIVELRGVITDERLRRGIQVAVENVPGVKGVKDELKFVPAIPGML